MNFHFNEIDEFLDFLYNASKLNENENDVLVFPTWEVMSLNIQARYGEELSINTRIVDTAGDKEYTNWKRQQSLVKTFLDQNSAIGATIDIRMRAPKELRQQMDENDEYSSFNLSFYSGMDVIMISSAAVEKHLPASYVPAEKWHLYIQGLVDFWRINYELKKQKNLQ